MEPAAYAKIRRNPKFVELVRQRGAFARNLTIAMLVIYFGFILLVAFGKGFLGTPISDGSVRLSRKPACISSGSGQSGSAA